MIKLPHSRYILPNVFTLAATFCGFALIWMAQNAESAWEFYMATLLLPVAALLDGFDGRVARLLHGESKFGMQLDSLSDAVTFGVAPAMLVYHWALEPLGMLGLAIAFTFAACAMMRLARFNVTAEEEGGSSRYFQGLPAPMGGMALAVLVALNTGVAGASQVEAAALPWISGYVLVMALLMVSNVRFRTFKDLRLSWLNRLLVASVLATVVVVSVLGDLMLGIGVGLYGYLLTGLTGGLLRRRARVRVPHGSAVLDDEDDDELLEEELGAFFEDNDFASFFGDDED